MRDWLMHVLASKIKGGIIMLDWYVDANGVPSFMTIPLDAMLDVLYGRVNEEGNLVLAIPEVGSYENLISGDADGAKGLRCYFEQWHLDGLIS